MNDTTEAQAEKSMGERIREAFAGLDMKSAMRIAFGKCPACGKRLVSGYWLRWCPDRTCNGYQGPKNKELGRRIEYVMPQTDAERAFVQRMQERDEFDAALMKAMTEPIEP